MFGIIYFNSNNKDLVRVYLRKREA